MYDYCFTDSVATAVGTQDGFRKHASIISAARPFVPVRAIKPHHHGGRKEGQLVVFLRKSPDSWWCGSTSFALALGKKHVSQGPRGSLTKSAVGGKNMCDLQ